MSSKCPNFGGVMGLHSSVLPGCRCQYTGPKERFQDHTWKLREWVDLSDDELESMAEQYVTDCYFDTLKYGQSIQSKLKEKNT